MDRRSERLIREMLGGSANGDQEKEKRLRFETAVTLLSSLTERWRAAGHKAPELRVSTTEKEGRADLMLKREELLREDMLALLTAFCYSDEFNKLPEGEGVSFTVYWDDPYDPLADCLLMRGLIEELFEGGYDPEWDITGPDFPFEGTELY